MGCEMATSKGRLRSFHVYSRGNVHKKQNKAHGSQIIMGISAFLIPRDMLTFRVSDAIACSGHQHKYETHAQAGPHSELTLTLDYELIN
jgi:hypothetical protein